MEHVLDNPVWNALTSHGSHLGGGEGDVRYFDPEVSPFAAMKEDTEANLQALYEQHPGERGMFLWTAQPLPPLGSWKQLHLIPGLQMVYDPATNTKPEIQNPVTLHKLNETHIPAMLALTALTRPGPFDTRTIEFGNYEGIFEDDRLVAMTGQRFHCKGHVEVSAVCTHPDALGKGYAGQLLQSQVLQILAGGETPFLHVRDDNDRAIAVYERFGFRVRMPVFFYVLKK